MVYNRKWTFLCLFFKIFARQSHENFLLVLFKISHVQTFNYTKIMCHGIKNCKEANGAKNLLNKPEIISQHLFMG